MLFHILNEQNSNYFTGASNGCEGFKKEVVVSYFKVLLATFFKKGTYSPSRTFGLP
jgi:hypothetical protein